MEGLRIVRKNADQYKFDPRLSALVRFFRVQHRPYSSIQHSVHVFNSYYIVHFDNNDQPACFAALIDDVFMKGSISGNRATSRQVVRAVEGWIIDPGEVLISR